MITTWYFLGAFSFLILLLVFLLHKNINLSDFIVQSGAQLPQFSATALVLAGIILGSGVLLGYFTRNIWMQWGYAQKIIGFTMGMAEGLRSLGTVKNKPLFWFYSIGIWTCYVGTIAVGFTVFNGLESIGPEQAFFVSI